MHERPDFPDTRRHIGWLGPEYVIHPAGYGGQSEASGATGRFFDGPGSDIGAEPPHLEFELLPMPGLGWPGIGDDTRQYVELTLMYDTPPSPDWRYMTGELGPPLAFDEIIRPDDP